MNLGSVPLLVTPFVVIAVVSSIGILISLKRANGRSEGDTPAGLWVRIAALLFDHLLIGLLLLVIAVTASLLEALQIVDGWVWIAFFLAGVLAPIIYFSLQAYGRPTWGKRLVGLRLERVTDAPISYGRAFWRTCWLAVASTFVAFTLANLLVLSLHPQKRGLHDLLAGTRVRQARAPGTYIALVPLAWLVVIGLFVIGPLRTFFLTTYFIPGESMRPTFEVNDKIVANKLYYRFSPLRRGDIITFSMPSLAEMMGLPHSDVDYIKRVVGLPGETIWIQRNIGIFINGRQIADPHAVPDYDWPPRGHAGYGKGYRIPNDACFVLGDNRAESFDSHAWSDPETGELLPDVPLKNIKGKATLRFFPFDRIEVFP
ncbi:MAG: Signal peptidase I P [bacterium ADurb.Bin429]|nr:MAG: Signal peptidase I P [bacterium ADurb.Bin429]